MHGARAHILAVADAVGIVSLHPHSAVNLSPSVPVGQQEEAAPHGLGLVNSRADPHGVRRFPNWGPGALGPRTVPGPCRVILKNERMNE